MDRKKATEILNRIISLKGDVYDMTNKEGDFSIKSRISRSIDSLEEAESHLKEALQIEGDK